ncbi:hypothetical protein [Luteitalea sp.]|uniref:hypothetical protein n=1 Tax=Luteitalea sp. TaxID=2004800 RepID=UPI0025C73B36|nr:hypothetical protein [Luteitalea sp.]
MGALVHVFTRRPAATLFAVRAGLNLAMAYGLHLSVEQMSSTMLFTEALFGIFGDATTTPNAKLHPETVEAAKAGKQP